jgi:transcriptional regulator with XRE-family HTH domain
MDIVKLLNFIEDLRYERNITQEAFLSNVISQRQYYRYRYGESEAPFEVITKFADKLDIPFFKLLAQFKAETDKEQKKVETYFNYVINKRLVEADKLFNQFSKLKFIENDSKRFIKLGKTIYDFYKGSLSKFELVNILKRIINYDDILKKDSIYDIELYMLGIIMEYNDIDRKNILKHIISLNNKNKLIVSGNRLYITQGYFWITKNLGREKKFKEVIRFADEAIKYCKKEYSCYCLEYFYYYKALVYYKMGEQTKFEEELYNTIVVLLSLKEVARDNFINTIKKDTDISSVEFLLNKLEKETSL